MIIALLSGGGLVALGFLLGRIPGRRRRGPRPVKPVWGCDHHFSMHDAQTGHCHELVQGRSVPVRDKAGNPVKDAYGYVQKTHEKVQCGCRRYSGPEPMPSLYAPEIIP